MSHEAKTLWESDGKTPDGNPFISIKQARGYYNYASRGGQDSVFFILYDRNKGQFALIKEAKPPLDERLGESALLTTAFGGSIDSEDSYPEIVQTETLEEAGYEVPLENIHYMGSTLVSSQMDQIANGYLVDVTNIEKTQTAEYEQANATEEFVNNEVIWMDYQKVMNNSDWKSIFLMAKLMNELQEQEEVSDA